MRAMLLILVSLIFWSPSRGQTPTATPLATPSKPVTVDVKTEDEVKANLSRAMKHITGLNKGSCTPTPAPTATPLPDSKYEWGELEVDGGRKIQVSVVPEFKLKRLFAKLAKNPEIPFQYPEDGCYARAAKMSMLLEQEGVFTGKVFMEGDLCVDTKSCPMGFVKWWYHVAPVVLVKKNGKLEPYVLDPSLFKKPVPVKLWQHLQTGGVLEDQSAFYYTDRFHYDPMDRKSNLTTYAPKDIKNMNETLADYVEIQNGRKNAKK